MKTIFTILLPCFFLFLFLFSPADAISSPQPLPQASESFNISYIQQVGSCSYGVLITTSCSSPAYTRDQISVAFGDAYGNQVYAPRIDDPSTRTFERCSSDSFQINGPCSYQICYLYLYRSGPDGWVPSSVKISGYNTRDVTFKYDTNIPGDMWFGFNWCSSSSSSNHLSTRLRFMFVISGVIVSLIF